jgi:uncharacterized glyoxalase superfamily protein PhnB
MSRTIDAVRVVPLLATRDPQPLLTFFSKALGIKAHWKHEDGDGRVVHAEVLWGSDRISITAGEPLRCSLGLEVEDEATVERLFERALSASARVKMGLTHSKVAYGFTIQDSEGNQYWIHAETVYPDQLRREQSD